MGTKYEGFRQPDGKGWTILALPVFAETVDDRDPDNPVEFTAQWIHEAVHLAMTEEGRGYYPPVHLHHHEPGRKPEYAGKCRNFRVAPFEDCEGNTGRQVPTLFVDLFDCPEDVARDVIAGRWPYRSVEIKRPDEPRISSLALLDDQEPYFRFPVTDVEVVHRHSSGVPQHRRTLVATTQGGGCSFLFAFETRKPMAEDKTFQEEDLVEPEEGAPAAEGEESSGGDMEEIKSMLQQIIEKLDGVLGGEGSSDEGAAAPNPEGEEMARGEYARQFAAMSAQIQKTGAELAAMKATKALEDRLAEWTAKRYAFDADRVRKEARTFQAKGVLKDYLDAMEKNLVQAPPEPGADTRQEDAVDLTDPVLAQFAALPRKYQEKAQEVYAYWRSTPAVQGACGGDPAKFVAGHVSQFMRDQYVHNPEDRETLSRLRRSITTANGRN